jgi:hypothetical protein
LRARSGGKSAHEHGRKNGKILHVKSIGWVQAGELANSRASDYGGTWRGCLFPLAKGRKRTRLNNSQNPHPLAEYTRRVGQPGDSVPLSALSNIQKFTAKPAEITG